MSEQTNYGREASGALMGALALAVVLALGALGWCFGLNNHLSAAEKKLAAAEQRNTELAQKQDLLAARLKATTETLAQSVGITQRQLEIKTEGMMQSQKILAQMQSAQTAKLAERQDSVVKQVSAVAQDVTSVKTDVTGAKTSIAATQSDLDTTKAQLQRTMGDAGVMSGLIARNHDELETLKHRGDRTYFEFTLQKGAKPTLISTIKLQAKKVDDKHSKFTLMVSADDRNIEKKDKSLDEPVQFYTGKDPVLYEIVVNVISKNVISGYLSAPKGTPAAMSAASN